MNGRSTTQLSVVDIKDLKDLDLLIVAASASERAEGDRRLFLDANYRILLALAPRIAAAVGRSGIVVVVTNPVDVLGHVLRQFTGLEPRRILGYTLNDSIRFRIALAREFAVSPRQVSAYVLGEHGDGQVPLFSRVRMSGRPVTVSPEARRRVDRDIRSWFQRWSTLGCNRSTGWTTATGIITLCRAIARGGVMPVSVATCGSYGLPDSFVTLPVALNNMGVHAIKDWRLELSEREALYRAALSVRAAADSVMRAADTA